MAFQELPTDTEIGLREILNFPNLDTPIFYPVILFVIFIVFTLGTFFRQVKREGKGNFVSSMAVASFVTTTIAFVLSLLGLIQKQVVITATVIFIILQVIYMLTKR